jgi:hypothetical protein
MLEKEFDLLGRFEEDYKQYQEEIPYQQLKSQKIAFDADQVKLENVTDLMDIIHEINEISKKLFVFGVLYEGQSSVVQKLEDEFDIWIAEKTSKLDSKIYKSDKARERFAIVTFKPEFEIFKTDLRKENYKLGLLKRVINSLESYSYKLHSIKDYNMSAYTK